MVGRLADDVAELNNDIVNKTIRINGPDCIQVFIVVQYSYLRISFE